MVSITQVPRSEDPTLRSEVALCCLLGLVCAGLIAYAPHWNRLLVSVLFAVFCGIIIRVPDSMTVGRIALLCLPVGLSVILGIALWFVILTYPDKPSGSDLYDLAILSFFAIFVYPILLVGCLARPATVRFLDNLLGIVERMIQRDGRILKFVVLLSLSATGIGLSDLPNIVAAIFKA